MSVWDVCVCVYVFKEVFLVPRPRRRPHPRGEGGKDGGTRNVLSSGGDDDAFIKLHISPISSARQR